MPTGPTGIYAVQYRPTSAITTMTGLAADRDHAIAAAAQVASTGPTGTEAHVWQTAQIGATGPTAIFATTINTTGPMTGPTCIAVSKEHAHSLFMASGPTGPGAGIAIFQTTGP
jgi:hypothetical protein